MAAAAPEYRSARALVAELAAGRVSARELLDAAVARHELLKSSINAVVRVRVEQARQEAAEVDDARARGETLGPLAGLPITVKEVFDLEDLPATSANKAWLARAAAPDAEVVRRARAAGAIVWGKTNSPFMAGDYQSFNGIWGTTNNPYDVRRTPGGSSGGGAAALAAGITSLEIGSDLGGSIRTPAGFCGVVGLKPTWGALPQRGHVPPDFRFPRETDMGVVGPLARDAEDARLMWRVLSGHAPDASVPKLTPKTLRLALIGEQDGWPLAREVKSTLEATAAKLGTDGATVEVAKPAFDLDPVLDAYFRLVAPIIGADVPDALYRFGKLVYPFRRWLEKPKVDLNSQMLMLTYMVSSHRDWLRADSARWQMQEAMRPFFERFDAIMMPGTPTWAFPHDHRSNIFARKLLVDGVTQPYYSMLCWISLASALKLPAVSVRAGTASDGLPIGVQIVGPEGSEERLLDIAALIEERGGGFMAPLALNSN